MPARALGENCMARRLFGTRKQEHAADWPQVPQLPGAFAPIVGSPAPLALPLPPPPLPVGAAPPTAPAAELLDRIAGFRGAVSDSLYEASKDYQMLCNLTHADLTACDEILAELRQRLAGNIHYEVLAKLDEALALVAGHIGRQ
jgi:hypothetical protein